MGRELIFWNHGNLTRSLRKLFSFYDPVKAGVCINVSHFHIKDVSDSPHVMFVCLIAVLWLASPGQALAETPSTTC